MKFWMHKLTKHIHRDVDRQNNTIIDFKAYQCHPKQRLYFCIAKKKKKWKTRNTNISIFKHILHIFFQYHQTVLLLFLLLLLFSRKKEKKTHDVLINDFIHDQHGHLGIDSLYRSALSATFTSRRRPSACCLACRRRRLSCTWWCWSCACHSCGSCRLGRALSFAWRGHVGCTTCSRWRQTAFRLRAASCWLAAGHFTDWWSWLRHWKKKTQKKSKKGLHTCAFKSMLNAPHITRFECVCVCVCVCQNEKKVPGEWQTCVWLSVCLCMRLYVHMCVYVCVLVLQWHQPLLHSSSTWSRMFVKFCAIWPCSLCAFGGSETQTNKQTKISKRQSTERHENAFPNQAHHYWKKKTYCPSLGGSPVGLLATLLSVCPCVCSLHKCMRFKQQLESTLHGTWDGFTSRPVLPSPWSPTPCWLVLKFWLFVHEFARLWLCRLFSFCTVQSPAHHRAYRDAQSWPWSQTWAQQVEWCRCTC